MRKRVLGPLIVFISVYIFLHYWERLSISNSQAEAIESVAVLAESAPTVQRNSERAATKIPLNEAKPLVEATPEHLQYPELSLDDVYCRLLAAGINVSSKENLKFTFIFNPFAQGSDSSLKVWMHSQECPAGTFSQVELDRDGQILSSNDCRDKKREDAFLGGLQGNIVSTFGGEEDFNLNLAISGDGLFVAQCENETLYVRRGDFSLNADGTVTTRLGCVVLNKEATPLRAEPHMEWDEQGCNLNGDCVAIVLPKQGMFEVQNRDTFLALGDPMESLMDKPYVMAHSLEDTENPENGILGPDFPRLPVFEKPRSCANHK